MIGNSRLKFFDSNFFVNTPFWNLTLLQNEFIGGVAVKTMRISGFNDNVNFNQSDSNISFWIIRYEAVVW